MTGTLPRDTSFPPRGLKCPAQVSRSETPMNKRFSRCRDTWAAVGEIEVSGPSVPVSNPWAIVIL